MKSFFRVVAILSLALITSNCSSIGQIHSEVSGVMQINYASLGIKNDGSLGKSGKGYGVFVRLSGFSSTNDSYLVGVIADNGTIWSKNGVRPDTSVATKNGEKWAAIAEVHVPSELFTKVLQDVEQSRQAKQDKIASLKYDLGKLTLNAIQAGAWITGPSPADQKRADQIQSEIDALNNDLHQDIAASMIPYIIVKVKSPETK